MGMLDNIQTGRENKPPRIMIYGSEGIGKSSYAAGAPNAIFIQTEDGLGEIDCRKFPLAHSLSEVIAELTALRDEAHEFQTVVVDSVDWLERLIFDEVCREFGVRSIEKADGGYGRGYTHALTHWRKVISLLQELRDKRGMMVILVAHAKVERFEDPENAAYDRYTPRLHKHAASLIAGMGRRRSVREQEVPGDEGKRRIQRRTRDRRSHRRGWRGTHHPHGGKPRLHREEPLRSAVGNSALVAGIH